MRSGHVRCDVRSRLNRHGWARLAASVGVGLAQTIAGALASDWPHWRGPDRTGVSRESGWLEVWPSDGPKVTWKAKVGLGFSSFAVADGRVFTMGHADEQDTVFCFDAVSGRQLWKHSYPAELGDKYFDGGTTGTPTVAGGQVFTLNRWGEAICFQAADGKVVWQKNILAESGARVPDWGFGGSPLVHGDLVILNAGDSGLALDRSTGALRWKSAAKSAGYSTPLPVARADGAAVLLSTGNAYVAVAPADGRELWRVKWLTQYGVNAADPIVEGDRVFVSSGYGKGAALIKWGGGDAEPVWKSKVLRTQLNGAVLHKGHLYGVDGDTTEKAALKCVELATGTEKWSHAGFGSGGLVIADGRILALSGTGELMTAPAVPEGFKPGARAQVLGGQCWTAPVLANGLVYCRNSRGDVAVVDLRRP